MQMDKDDIRCAAFRCNKGTVVCTLEKDLLRIRVEDRHQSMDQVYILSISAKSFPDTLRHTYFQTPLKLFQHLQQNGEKVLLIQQGIIAVKIDKDVFIKLQTSRYKKEDFLAPQPRAFLEIYWDLETPHAKEYLIEGSRLSKIKDGWTQITSRNALSKDSPTRIKFRYLAYGGKYSIGFGITTNSRKKQQYSGDTDQKQSAGYWSRNGYKSGCFCHDGIKTHDWSKETFTPQGQIMQMVLIPGQWVIRWQNKNKVVTIALANCFKEEDLYLSVVMFDKGSKVELII